VRELTFLWLTLADKDGTVEMLADQDVELQVTGGELLAFGSARRATEEPLTGPRTRTHRGRALAILRPTSPDGEMVVTATSTRSGTATLLL
jgi:beta-galactosidase